MHSERDFHPLGKGIRIFGMLMFGVVTAIIFGLLFGYFIELLWNWLMPSIFKLDKITYWQAFGLVLLARLIFGSIGHGHGNSYHPRYRHLQRYKNWERSDWRDRDHYDNWWREEGKTAFEKYIAKVEHKEEISE